MERTNIAYEEELKKKRHKNWLKADVQCIKYLREGLVEFVDEVVKKQHENIMKEFKGRKCTQCRLQSLLPNHKMSFFRNQPCPLEQDQFICNDGKVRSPCKRNICGSIFDTITKLYFFYPPTPCWKNTDVKKWCGDPWSIAKCFISFPGYWPKSGPQDIDITGLLHILINNKGLHRHLECPISQKGEDVFCRVRKTREEVVRNNKQELDDKELEDYIDDMIEILQDKKELCDRREAKEAVEKLLQLKYNDLVIPPLKNLGSRSLYKVVSDRGLAASELNTSVEYQSKYESEFVHKSVLGSGAFGVVFEAENIVDGLSYAVKRITLRKSVTIRDTVRREVTALAKLEHPNIVRYFHAWTEIPPPGWQEQKDQQRGISESQNTLSSSNTTSMVSSASLGIKAEAHVDAGSPSTTAKSQDRKGEKKKKGLTDFFDDPFGQTLFSQIDEHSRRDSSDSRETCDESSESEKTGETSVHDSQVFSMKNSRSTVEMLPSSGKKYLGTSQHNQQNLIVDKRNEQMQKNKSTLMSSKDKNRNKLFFYIQMQLCKPETLAQWLEQNTLDASREKQKILDWFKQILSAVGYVHEQGFLHRDLKPSNIFFSKSNEVKVGDFGFATALEEDQDLEIYSEAGTYLYMAPEVVKKCGKKSNKVDIYSLGIILFELLYSFHTQIERIHTLEDVKKLCFPENFTREMPEKKKLISKMLAENPEERPTPKEILREIMFAEMPKRARRETM